jgi:hypothetical protein
MMNCRRCCTGRRYCEHSREESGSPRREAADPGYARSKCGTSDTQAAARLWALSEDLVGLAPTRG